MKVIATYIATKYYYVKLRIVAQALQYIDRLDENALADNMRVNNTSVWTMLTSIGGGVISEDDRLTDSPASVATVIPGRGPLSPQPEIPSDVHDSSEEGGREPEQPVDPQLVLPIPALLVPTGKHHVM